MGWGDKNDHFNILISLSKDVNTIRRTEKTDTTPQCLCQGHARDRDRVGETETETYIEIKEKNRHVGGRRYGGFRERSRNKLIILPFSNSSLPRL